MSDPLNDPNTLPLQVFTTCASLLELVDKPVVVTMRDGRVLYAFLRSFDAFANLVLQNTYERIFFQGKYAEEYRGVWVIRGENTALVGELDQSKDEEHTALLASLKKIEFAQAEELLEESKHKYEKSYETSKAAQLRKGLTPSLSDQNPYLY